MASQHEKPDSGLFGWLGRKLAPPESPADDAVEERPDAWPSFVPFRRRPKPLVRVVRWEPNAAEPTSGREAPDSWDLFMSQELLREVRAHLAAAPEHEAFGFLVGRLYYCPWTKSSYVLGDGVLKSPDPLASGQNEAQFRDIWHAAWKEARGQEAEIVGWYHRHGLLGVQLSQHDVELHKTFFPEPWQSALVVVLGQAGSRGGFIRRTEGQLFFNRILTGFYELAGPDVDWKEDARPTVIDWDNHSAEDPVRLLDLPELPDVQPSVVESVAALSGGIAADTDAPEGEALDGQISAGTEAVTATPQAKETPVESVELTGDGLDLHEGGSEAFADAIQPLSGYDPVEGSISQSETMPGTGPAVEEPVKPAKTTPKRKRPQIAARLDPTDPDLAEFLDVIRGPAPYSAEAAEALIEPGDIPLPGPAPEPVETRHEPERVARDDVKWESSEEPDRPVEGVERKAPEPTQSIGPPFRFEADEAPHHARSEEETVHALMEQIDEILALCEPPPSAPAATPPSAPAPSPAPAREGQARTLRSAMDSAALPEQDYDYRVPVVMPAANHVRLTDLLRRHWKLAAGTGVVALVAVVALLRTITGEAPTDPGDLRPPAMAVSGDIQFQQLGQAVAREIIAYDERRADFELGRTDCASLTIGHTEVSRAFIAYSERFAIVGTRLAVSDRLEYQRLAGEARAATRHFEQAGCASA